MDLQECEPVADSDLVIEVSLDYTPLDKDRITIMMEQIRKSTMEKMGIELAHMHYDEPSNTLSTIIKGNRISPKESKALGQKIMGAFQADDYKVIVTTQ